MIQRQYRAIMHLPNAFGIATANDDACGVHHIYVVTNDGHGSIDNLLC